MSKTNPNFEPSRPNPNFIPVQVYQPCEELIADKDNLRRIEEELRELEKVFLKRLFRKCGVSSSESLIDEFESSKANQNRTALTVTQITHAWLTLTAITTPSSTPIVIQHIYS